MIKFFLLDKKTEKVKIILGLRLGRNDV